MKAWLFTGAHQPLQLIEQADPRPGAPKVTLALRGSGLCHSDATHCVLPVDSLLRLPAEVSFTQGAAATDAGHSLHHALKAGGQLTISVSTVDFDKIPQELERLQRGGGVGRTVAGI